ncbi:MAG: radical SAM protein [Deltaproteobacteria bacterium]|nr:radical SAM protein [Deltaproteobacteria bacterium]
MSELLVTEIFRSIQGESSWAGYPCTFVRLTGCPLRCRWCDTAYSFSGGKPYSIAQIVDEVARLGVPLVELTGGEPLAQKQAPELINALLQKGYKVLLETGGSESLAELPPGVHIIMDIKCPGSGMTDRMNGNNLKLLKASDEIKFVVSSREDFLWACRTILDFALDKKFPLLFSPAWGLVTPQDLTQWILESGFQARLNLQLHKFIWGPRKRGV